MSRRYPPEFHKFMADYIPGHTAREISAEVSRRFGFDYPASAVKSYKQNHHIPSGTRCGVAAGAATALFPDSIMHFLIENQSGRLTSDIVRDLNERFNTNYTDSQVRAFYTNRKLCSGVNTRFKPGTVPPNKGKQVDWSLYPAAVAARFSAGHKPWNYMPVGSLVRKSDGYWWRKIKDGKRGWRQEHILIWEAANGPIKKGDRIIFLDSNVDNLELSNLARIDNAMLLELSRKGLRFTDAGLTESGIHIVKLLTTINNRRTANNGDKKQSTT